MQPNNPWQPNNPYQQPPQPPQQPGGQYQVVPPPQVSPNNGHSGHNPYEFIVAPTGPTSRGLSFGSGNSFLLKIGLLVGGAIVLLILGSIILSMVGPKDNKAAMTTIVQHQQELVRIADDASTKATGQDTKNFASTVSLSVQTSQTQVIGYLQQRGTKLNKKTLALGMNPKTDTLLADAATSGTYDAAVVRELVSELQAYEQELKASYQSAGKTSKPLLADAYTVAASLAKQGQSLTN